MFGTSARYLAALAAVGLLACGVSEQEEAQAIALETEGPPEALFVEDGESPAAPPEDWWAESFDSEEIPELFTGASEVESLSVTPTGGSVDLRPNVLRGKARLTNQNPEVLALLAADPWHSSGRVSVNSTSPGGFSASTTAVKYTSPAEFTFEMLVEAAAGGENGVVYNVSAARGPYHGFPLVSGVRVKPRNVQPEPTEVELNHCFGVVQIQFGTDESCETSPTWARSLSVNGLRTFWNQGYLTGYVGNGSSYKTVVSYIVDTEVGPVRTWVPVEWNDVKCDEVVRICKVPHVPPTPTVPPPPELGGLTGPFEILGESLTYARSVGAFNGPGKSSGSQSYRDANPAAPLGDPSTWWELTNLRVGTYDLAGSGYLRKGRQFTVFRTPNLSGRFSVVADQLTPVTRVIDGETRHAFSMRPSYFYGAVRLADPYVPLHPGSTSTLQTLYFEADHDSNGDGIPNDPRVDETRLHASSGAGYSMSAFPGTFEPASGELASNYEQVLPHPYDLPSTWTQSSLRLRFWSQGQSFSTRPGLYDPEQFRSGALALIPKANRSKLLAPEERHRIDHEYCFNEVQFFLRTELGRFYNPEVAVTGAFDGTDWQGRTASYSVSGNFFGDPFINGYSSPKTYAKQTGLLSMALPQGTFTLKPSAYMVNDAGDVNSANFEPLSVSLGCGQRLKLVPPLAVVINPINRCAAGRSVPVSGVVKSLPAEVDRIWYQINNGPEVTLCTHCGKDPTFSFTADLKACENTIKVFAFTEGLPEPATGSQQLVWDDPADGPSCPGTYCLNRPPVARCRSVTVPADESCTSGCGSVDDGSYDPDVGDTITCTQTPDCPYTLGTQRVTLSCADSAGNTSFCEANVTVKDMVRPTIACPAEPHVLACMNGGAQASYLPTASDNCGSVITQCTPPSGSTFPLGTTATVCTASDEAGNRASCSFDVTVRDEAPPQVTCPEPLTAECTGNGAATVVPGNASVADVCTEASVTGPGEASWPLGTHTLAYLATDTSGNTATCTSTLTVRDTQPPEIQCPAPVKAECTDNGGADVLLGDASASDVCTPTQVQGPTATRYLVGTHPVTYSAMDASGNTATCTSTVTVEDTQPPVVRVGAPVRLWAPNHGYHTVRLADCGLVVEDACSGLLSEGQVRAAIDCVSSDEPRDAKGDGHTEADILLVDATTVKLRAERKGGGDGRVYRIHFTVKDGAGNAVPAVCTAVVAHDQRGTQPVDSGESYRVCRP